MKIFVTRTAMIFGCLLLAGIPISIAQNPSGDSTLKTVGYRLGQVWIADQGIIVTILAVDDVYRVGKVVHIRVDKVPFQDCGNIHLTRAIEHLAVTEKVMQKSGLVLSQENAVLPESSLAAYRTWETQKKREVIKQSLSRAILGEGSSLGPMICNFVPSKA